jgi:HEAT repeats
MILMFLVSGAGCAQLDRANEQTKQFFDRLSGRPRRAAVRTTDRYFPDERREGINQLVERDYGKRPPYTDQYANIARDDSDFLVRATAIRALNRSRHRESTPVFVNALGDAHELVRLEAAKALVNMPDEKAVPGLIKLVTNPQENRDVRIAAAEALKHYRNIDAARALVGTLAGREFGLAWQAHKSLVRITGKDLRYDEAAWLTYIANPDRPFS